MLQAISDYKGNASPDQTKTMISDGNTAPVSTKLIPRVPPTVNNMRTTKAALRNRTSLNIRMQTSGGFAKGERSRKKAKISNSQFEQYTKAQIKLLLKSINAMVGARKEELMMRLEENRTVKELGVMSLPQLQAKCAELGLHS